MKPKHIFIVIVAACAIAGIGWYLIWALSALEDVEMGLNGWIALIIGVLATFALGFGLMRLIYISNRRGYD